MNIKLRLYATWWQTPPKITVSVDNQVYFSGKLVADKKEPWTFELDHDTKDNTTASLSIELSDKDDFQTVLENGQIIKDQLLHIDGIEINNIELGLLVYKGVYRPRYHSEWLKEQQSQGNHVPETLQSVDVLGHNGTWSLDFTLPFHIWYLENLP